MSQISEITLEMNGIQEQPKMKERLRGLIPGFVHK